MNGKEFWPTALATAVGGLMTAAVLAFLGWLRSATAAGNEVLT
jgi:hypothetical protein